MKFKLNRYFTLFFALLFVGFLVTGCQKTTAKVAPLKFENKLSLKGDVAAKSIKTIAGKDNYYNFSQKTPTADYTWTYLGSQIKNPVKQKLGLTITSDNLTHIKQKAGHAPYAVSFKIKKFYLAGQPTLTITLPKKWHANHVIALTKQDNQLRELTTAEPSITTKNNSTVLTMKVNTTNIRIYLVAGQTSDQKLIKENKIAQELAAKTGPVQVKKELIRSEQTKKTVEHKKSSSKKSSHSKSKSSSSSDNSKESAKSSSKKSESNSNSSSSNSSSSASEEKQDTDEYVTLSIDCSTLLEHMDDVKKAKRPFVPSNGIILPATRVKLNKNDSVYDILVRATSKNGIQMEASFTPVYNSYYIEGINQLYEFDAGSLSGWMYSVNGWYPNYGVSEYNSLRNGDNISFNYTLSVGHDLGAN